MPTGLQFKSLLMGIAIRVPPTDLDRSYRDRTQTQVNIRGAFSGIAAASVDVGNPFTPIRQLDSHGGADGRAPRNFVDRMTDARFDERCLSFFQREQQVEPKKIAGLG